MLDTGKLHAETLALIGLIEKRYTRSVEVYRPKNESVIKFVRHHGEKAMYDSIELRKQCCDIRKMEPLARALAGKDGWITGLRREQSNARAEVADIVQEPGRVKISPSSNGPGATCGTSSPSTSSTTTPCTTSSSPASAASPAPAPSASAKTSAPAAGGGSRRAPRNAACTSSPSAKPAR
ncbi:Phosphoadenosine phosphosulfate reductase [Hydrogenophaga sp. T4]|nr:Phosphoadenosine phosphosulfate reductase [Hydrogenophaga sp. T4]